MPAGHSQPIKNGRRSRFDRTKDVEAVVAIGRPAQLAAINLRGKRAGSTQVKRTKREHLAYRVETTGVVTPETDCCVWSAAVTGRGNRGVVIAKEIPVQNGLVQGRVAFVAALLPASEPAVQGDVSEKLVRQGAVARPAIGLVDAFGDPDLAWAPVVDPGIVKGVLKVGKGACPGRAVVGTYALVVHVDHALRKCWPQCANNKARNKAPARLTG